MAKLQGLRAVVEHLRDKAAKMQKEGNVSVAVGFTAAYALYVHENTEARHNHGEAKFLETPFRLLHKELTDIVVLAKKQGKTLAQALLLAGLRLQREAQKLCPVDTGNLKNSAFTRLET